MSLPNPRIDEIETHLYAADVEVAYLQEQLSGLKGGGGIVHRYEFLALKNLVERTQHQPGSTRVSQVAQLIYTVNIPVGRPEKLETPHSPLHEFAPALLGRLPSASGTVPTAVPVPGYPFDSFNINYIISTASITVSVSNAQDSRKIGRTTPLRLLHVFPTHWSKTTPL